MTENTLTAFEVVTRSWPIIIAFITLIVWLSRVESKQNAHKESSDMKFHNLQEKLNDHKDTSEKKEEAMWKKIEKLQTDTNTVLTTLARIEEKLKHIIEDQ